MAFYDIFDGLCSEKGVTPTQVARDIGIKQSVVAMWKKRGSTPKYETLAKLADYFHVSANCLVGEGELWENMKTYRKLKGITQKELSEKTDISLKMIQHYEDCNSGYFITEKDLLKIATFFDVQPLVLLGRSVTQDWLLSVHSGNCHTRMNEAFFKLNIEGQQKVADYAEDLVKIPKYKRPDTPPPSPEGKDTTPPEPPLESPEKGG